MVNALPRQFRRQNNFQEARIVSFKGNYCCVSEESRSDTLVLQCMPCEIQFIIYLMIALKDKSVVCWEITSHG